MNTQDITKRYRPFAVDFIGPSNTKGSRFSIRDLRHGKSKLISLDHAQDGQASDQALRYLESIGIHIHALMLCDFGPLSEVTLLSEDFYTPLK